MTRFATSSLPSRAGYSKGISTPLSARTSVWLHCVVLIIGALIIFSGAFHPYVWFDESYSVGIANHSYADIWRIGSGDVHPVLYYWALHTLHLFGGEVIAYRVFTALGAWCMALIGFTHIRREFNPRVGLIYSAIVVFLPYVSFIAIEVRMYSWAACMVMLTFIYAFRIGRARFHALSPATQKWYWLSFSVCSLASAYLHYFALMSVFIINIGLLVTLIRLRHEPDRVRDVMIWVVQAVIEVALYIPWLIAFVSQLGVVSSSYWARFVFPDTLITLLRYPVLTMQLDFAWMGEYGVLLKEFMSLVVILGLLLGLFALRGIYHMFVRQHAHTDLDESAGLLRRVRSVLTRPENVPGFLGLGVYLGLFILSVTASIIIHSYMVYFRYMYCAIGPLIFSLAWLLHRISSRRLTLSALGILFVCALVNQSLIIRDDYSDDNGAPIAYLAAQVEDGELVLSSDIGIEGVTAVELPQLSQHYLDWQHGNWGLAYEAYAPTLTNIKSWDDVLSGYEGDFWVLGQSSHGERPKDVSDLAQKDGCEIIESAVFFRPYERTYFTITHMYKHNESN